MPTTRPRLSSALGLSAAAVLTACNSLLGLDELSVRDKQDASAPECNTHQECTLKLSQDSDAGGDAGAVAALCVRPEQKCVPLFTPDCPTAFGDYQDENAIVIGSLFGLTGAQAPTNLARQRAAVLALEQINRAGGVPSGTTSAQARRLVMLSCNADLPSGAQPGTRGLLPAARHLVDALHVPAIVGPNTSQDTLDVSRNVTIAGGTVVLTPSALASEIAGLSDRNLTWLMIPSDVQRAPLMINQINELETRLGALREKEEIKLSIIYRNDALGIGTNASLNAVVLNGQPLSAQLGSNVKVSPYEGTAPNQDALVDEHVAFRPDIVVLAGTAEAVTRFMIPIENEWQVGVARPHYVLIDSAKVTDLLGAVTVKAENIVPDPEGLRKRVRGTGATPGADTPSRAVFDTFKIEYITRYPDNAATDPDTGGVAPSYDATFAIAYALAATHDKPVTGASVALGLPKLSGGPTTITTGATTLLPAFQRLVAGENITAIGTFGALEWDRDGAPAGATVEVWCVAPGPTPRYLASGLEFNLKNQSTTGTFNAGKVCGCTDDFCVDE